MSRRFFAPLSVTRGDIKSWNEMEVKSSLPDTGSNNASSNSPRLVSHHDRNLIDVTVEDIIDANEPSGGESPPQVSTLSIASSIPARVVTVDDLGAPQLSHDTVTSNEIEQIDLPSEDLTSSLSSQSTATTIFTSLQRGTSGITGYIAGNIIQQGPRAPRPIDNFIIPQTEAELIRRVLDSSDTDYCSCDVCSPDLYDEACNNFRGHSRILQIHSLTMNMHGFPDYFVDFDKNGQYQILHLARESIKYFDKLRQELCTYQLSALQTLRGRFSGQRWGLLDAREGIHPEVIMDILQDFNEIFFFGVIPTIFFEWTPMETLAAGDSTVSLDGRASRIRLHPIHTHLDRWTSATEYARRKNSRICTLLHECIHVYLDRYACTNCAAQSANMSADNCGHGRAFLLIAAKLERVASELLGFEVLLGRMAGVSMWMEKFRVLPSKCDMKAFGFGLELSGTD